MTKINPRVDLAFKKIFGTEENKDLLISLINSTVGQEDQVVDVTILNPYNQKSFKQDKLSILDIKAKGTCGKKFNIEIQITDEADYDKRALYYWAKVYTEQLKSGEDYSELEKVIGHLDSIKSAVLHVLSRGPAGLKDFLQYDALSDQNHLPATARTVYWCTLKSMAREGAVKRRPVFDKGRMVRLEWRLV